MKLATYHRMRGDYVRFFKGDFKDLLSDIYAEEAIENFVALDSAIHWNQYKPTIIHAIRCRNLSSTNDISKLNSNIGPAIESWLKYYASAYSKRKVLECATWDRICITTLFTFYFKKTIETIEQSKLLLKPNGKLLVGGVMASLIPNEIKEVTGVVPHIGLLDKAGILDSGDKTIIDNLPLDYSILKEIDYKYPDDDGYYAYSSRGCIRHCKFCAVPHLEPKFKDFIPINNLINYTNKKFGSRRNLLLLDNNVLASSKFPQIIEEIHSCGFKKGATFQEPNYFKFAVDNLNANYNLFAHRRHAHQLIYEFRKRLKGNRLQQYDNLINLHHISREILPSKEQIINFYNDIRETYELFRNKSTKLRYVDFNQGIDARLLNEKNMEYLSTIPIKPLRIAFDSMKYAKFYENALRLAAKYKITNLSNYLLYNFEEEPVDLYRRMYLNTILSEELNLMIYSFPMRYSPIWDKNNLHHTRDYIGTHWKKKFIRSIQTILNATKGKVGTKKSFFKASFGKDENEFYELLYMPEQYILHRSKFKLNNLTDTWKMLFNSLNDDEKRIAFPIIESNSFQTYKIDQGGKIASLLSHYQNNELIINGDVNVLQGRIDESMKYILS